MKRFIFPVFVVMFFLPRVALGGSVLIGGYDVAAIAAKTIDVVAAKNTITADEAKGLKAELDGQKAPDPLIAGNAIVEVFDQLASLLVKAGIVTDKDIVAAKTAASKSGGVKIAGLNPVVLAASFLDLLAQKGLISLPEAQSILNSSKIR